jgi:hypothetical protein
MIQKNGLEAHPLGDTVLKILYAGEDEEMDIDGEGTLIIRSGGQEIIHKMDVDAINGKTPDNNAEMHD